MDLRRMPEPPCVWAAAGVIDYRPCGRAFDCDACPLDQALRGGGAAPGASSPRSRTGDAPTDAAVERYLAELVAGCTLRLDRAGSEDGLWLEPAGKGELRLGLDDLALRLLYPVDGVVLPRVGTWLQRGATCAWVNRRRLAVPLRCPIACEVRAVHPRPALRPAGGGGVGGKDGGTGKGRTGAAERWWLQVKAHEPVAEAAVYRHEALLAWYLHRLRGVHEHLEAVMACGAGSPVETALADGGHPEPDLEVVLGRERFEALVGALFPMRG